MVDKFKKEQERVIVQEQDLCPDEKKYNKPHGWFKRFVNKTARTRVKRDDARCIAKQLTPEEELHNSSYQAGRRDKEAEMLEAMALAEDAKNYDAVESPALPNNIPVSTELESFISEDRKTGTPVEGTRIIIRRTKHGKVDDAFIDVADTSNDSLKRALLTAAELASTMFSPPTKEVLDNK